MKSRIYQGIYAVALCLAFVACDDKIDPVISELDVERVFSPVGLEARVRNQTTIELTWDVRGDVSYYVVEFSEDPQFSSVVLTVEVDPTELPLQQVLPGETVYAIRVKGVSAGGRADSKWVSTSIATGTEQIFLSSLDGDIKATEATLRWPAASEVTHLIINPGATQREISEDERAAGVAVLTGLTGETNYTVLLKNGEKTRGSKSFTTLIDFGDATPIYPEDNIVTILDAAADGDSFVIFPGEYQLGSYAVSKSLTLSGYDPYDKPVIFGQFNCGATVARIELNYLDFRGNGEETTLGQFFNTSSANCNLATLVINGCEISNYTNNLIYNNFAARYGNVTIRNTYVHDIPGGGGDGIDFRQADGALTNLTVENCTFANGFRNFLRMQSTSSSIAFRNVTFYNISTLNNSNNNGLFRIATRGGSFEVRRCLMVGIRNDTDGLPAQVGNWTRGGVTGEVATHMNVATTSYGSNYYWDSPRLWLGLYQPADVAATELNPGFVNAAGGNFKVTNQTLIDNNIGDPRWLQ